MITIGPFKKFSHQFQKPEGLFGRLAGRLMATIGHEKNVWTISLLDLQTDDNVLEVGFGPGIGIELVSNVVTDGKIIGVDYSDVMVQQASKRNAKAIEKGLVQLQQADVSNLPDFDVLFDKVFTVNSIFFWEDPVQTLKQIRGHMQPGGKIAVTIQPFNRTDTDVKNYEQKTSEQLSEAGFTTIMAEINQTKHVATVCVMGTNHPE